MQPNTKLRVSVYAITLMAVVVMACVFAACTRNAANQNGNAPRTLAEQTASPSPSPTSSPSPELVPGDTIIVIKDGSVKIDVNKTLCSDDDNPSAPDDKKYKCDFEIGEMGIRTARGVTPVPTTPDSEITVDGGGGKEIV